MTIVVTGATGFLGRRVVEVLLENGYRVIATGRNQKIGQQLSEAGAIFVAGDLSRLDFVKTLVPEKAAIIHCAALSSPWGNRDEFYLANVVATQNLTNVALERGCPRFVQISTPSIYIQKGHVLGVSETDPLPKASINLYAETKRIAEELVDAATQAGLSAITIRPQGIFGPRDQTILPRLVRIAQNGILPVIGKQTEMDLTYVDNVVDSVVLALQADRSLSGKKFNITNGAPLPQTEAFQRLLKGLGFAVTLKPIPFWFAWSIASLLEWSYRAFRWSGEPLLTRYSVCVLAFSRTLNIDAARKELGYEPRISIEDGLQRTISWYKASNF